jgi:tRNA G10  N-methylase Trm11
MSNSFENVYCFISGKNWKLSLAEITSYLAAVGCIFEVSEFSRSYFLIRTKAPLEPSLINDLGGILKISKTIAFLPSTLMVEAFSFSREKKQAKDELKKKMPLEVLAGDIPAASSGKSVFGVSVYWVDPAFRSNANVAQRFIGSALKEELKLEGKKARFMGFPRGRENPQLTPVEVLKQGLLESRAEVLLCVGKNRTAVGKTAAVHNPFEFQKRDLDKPAQRKIFGVSPRIAKIMINLTHCISGKVFLDPFCGVGTFLMEALLVGANVVGLDINRWCVESARRNLDWVKREYSLREADYTVVQGDARELTQKFREEVDCIATEPDLGPALREVPTEPYAEKILQRLEPLFYDFISESYEVLRKGGYLALVTPWIKTRSGKAATLDVQRIASRIGYRVARPFEKVAFVMEAKNFPIRELSTFIDVDERHKIGREITLFQKN